MEAERGPLGSDLEFASLGHVFDAFERFVLLAVHVQPIYFQTCQMRKRKANMSVAKHACMWHDRVFGERLRMLKELMINDQSMRLKPSVLQCHVTGAAVPTICFRIKTAPPPGQIMQLS